MGRGWGAVVPAMLVALAAVVPAHAASPYTLERLSVGLIGADGKPAPATRVRSTPDMSTILIGSKGRLAGDEPAGDNDLDLFRVRDGGLERISPGLDDSLFIDALSHDGRTVVLSSPFELGSFEPYRLRDGTLTPLAPPAATHGAGGVGCVSPDGERVVFTSSEQLVPEDTDGLIDVYLWASGSVRRIGGGFESLIAFSLPIVLVRCSTDVKTVALRSPQKIDTADTDSAWDVYVWREGVPGLERASRGDAGAGNDDSLDAHFPTNNRAISDDGTRLLFYTAERLGDGDSDQSADLYMRAQGGLQRISVGPTGGNTETPVEVDDTATDPAMERVAFTTTERLVAADTDDGADAYMRSGSTTTLVGPKPASGDATGVMVTGASDDLATLLLTTNERLTADDNDESPVDLYRVGGDAAERIGRGAGLALPESLSGSSHGFRGATPDLSAVSFETLARLDGDDSDDAYDAYVWRAGAGVAPLVDPRSGPAEQCGLNSNGSLVLVCSDEPLTADDQGDQADIFLAALPGAKRPASLGPGPPPGTKPPAAPPRGGSAAPPTSARAAAKLLVRMLRALGGRKLARVRAFPFVLRLARTSRVEIKVRAGKRTVLAGRSKPKRGDVAVALRVPGAARTLLRSGPLKLRIEVRIAPRGGKVQAARAGMRLGR